MKLEFFKMQAQGNDYIYFDFLHSDQPQLNYSELAVKLSSRHKGIGSDGIVLLLPDPETDCFMRIFNADGSEALNCGSALRSISGYMHERTGSNNFRINTLSGIKTSSVSEDGVVEVFLGDPVIINKKVEISGFAGNLIQLGNIHFVVNVPVLPERSQFSDIAESILSDPEFSGKLNIEFVKVISPEEIEILIWERGSGATLACGTGACASAYSGITSNLLNTPINVRMPGGDVTADLRGKKIYLSGQVEYVFSGVTNI